MGRAYQINSDALLWKDFINGSNDAYHHIYSSYVQSLFKYGCHFTRDEALVKDCIQDVFVDLSKYKTSLGPTNNIKLYLFKSLKRKIIKSLSKGDIYSIIDTENIPFLYTVSSEDEMVENEQNQRSYLQLDKAMATLSPRQKEAIYLRFVSNLSYEEISKVMQMNYQSARNLVFRGVEKLRQSYPKDLIFFFLFSNRLRLYRI